MREKQKGSETRKPADPKHLAEAKHLLESKIKELESPESKFLFTFAESQAPADITESRIEAVWQFMAFLKSSGYHIINEKTVFCFPFGKMAKLSGLK